jgi:hypothetical protein
MNGGRLRLEAWLSEGLGDGSSDNEEASVQEQKHLGDKSERKSVERTGLLFFTNTLAQVCISFRGTLVGVYHWNSIL